MALQRRRNAELCNDPSDFEVRMDEGEAHAKTRRSYDRVATGTSSDPRASRSDAAPPATSRVSPAHGCLRRAGGDAQGHRANGTRRGREGVRAGERTSPQLLAVKTPFDGTIVNVAF